MDKIYICGRDTPIQILLYLCIFETVESGITIFEHIKSIRSTMFLKFLNPYDRCISKLICYG